MRKQFTPGQKAHIAIAALKGNQTVSQIASENEVHPTQVNQWQKIAKEGIPSLFVDKRKHEYKELQDKIDHLYKIIGQRDSELDWLKKKLHLDTPWESRTPRPEPRDWSHAPMRNTRSISLQRVLPTNCEWKRYSDNGAHW